MPDNYSRTILKKGLSLLLPPDFSIELEEVSLNVIIEGNLIGVGQNMITMQNLMADINDLSILHIDIDSSVIKFSLLHEVVAWIASTYKC